uniref:Uncharacterized protein n=1 Tax=Oryza rufipogon TaxID=4529 RepID=A0A0E0R9S5_ORYRU
MKLPSDPISIIPTQPYPFALNPISLGAGEQRAAAAAAPHGRREAQELAAAGREGRRAARELAAADRGRRRAARVEDGAGARQQTSKNFEKVESNE